MAFEEEVARGIALLDQRVPGWRSRIDVDTLDMSFGEWTLGCGCILTQVYGSYGQGLSKLLPLGHSSSYYGFFLPIDEDAWVYLADAWADLTAAWIRALTPGPVR